MIFAKCVHTWDLEGRSPAASGQAGSLVVLPTGEPGAVRLLQVPGIVTITSEVIHETRIIPLHRPLDRRAHASPEIREYLGDSRGHWDGEKLVVDTTNFNGKRKIQGSGPDMRP